MEARFCSICVFISRQLWYCMGKILFHFICKLYTAEARFSLFPSIDTAIAQKQNSSTWNRCVSSCPPSCPGLPFSLSLVCACQQSRGVVSHLYCVHSNLYPHQGPPPAQWAATLYTLCECTLFPLSPRASPNCVRARFWHHSIFLLVLGLLGIIAFDERMKKSGNHKYS